MRKQPKVTLQDALDFIHTHRGTSAAFRGMSDADIVAEILRSAEDNCTAYAIENSRIEGIVTGEVNHEYKLFFVHEMLCVTPRATLTLCCIFDRFYRGYDIQAIRDNSRDIAALTRYAKTERLIQLLARISARTLVSEVLKQEEQLETN